MTQLKALIVDDMQSMRLMIKQVLQQLGFGQVDQAPNGAKGFELVRLNGYDLVISDVEMPELSGLDMLGLIRKDAKRKQTPVIMLTAVQDRQQIMRAVEAGASGYLVKPVNPASLATRVRAVMNQNNKPLPPRGA
ncbi:MAG: response regulator [Gammaproteobacteria bacterium SHHR-1]|uniref:response regulator n=1 Tax=Magnetovirga frankeli TaxID=947516 RepID=UPI001293DB16|nr:response regulator [gamma proteobacterium SS-5]